MVGSSGLEPPTSRLSGVRSNLLSYEPLISVKKNGPGEEIRTPDPMVPNHVRYQTALHPEFKWQGWQDLNPRHMVLETIVLPD